MSMDVLPTNDDRAFWAEMALRAFGSYTGQKDESYFNDEEAILEIGGDFMANFLHFLRKHGVDADEIIRRGFMHFAEEVREEVEEEAVVLELSA